MSRPVVRFEEVRRAFDGHVAVDGLSLDVMDGEFFALLGPSGCGKTTLLRMLAGLEAPDGGRILLDGRDITGTPPHARPVHMMFQSYALFPHLDVAANVAFGLKQQRLPRAEIAGRVEEMLALVRLEGLQRRRVDQLSGGQRQRVALARALAPRPRILLLDEPLAALDRKLREETRLELKALQRRLGSTFLIVTHDQDEAMVLADRLAVMDQGRIAQLGAPAEVYESPANRFVAEFLGEVNLIEATVSGRLGPALQLTSPEAPHGLLAREPGEVSAGRSALLAIRPEKVRLHQDPPPAGANWFSGRVRQVGYLGDWTTYAVETGAGRLFKAARANLERAPERPVVEGAQVWLTFSPDAAAVMVG